MTGFDQAGIFVSDPFNTEETDRTNSINPVNEASVVKRFKQFIRKFHDEKQQFTYREQLRRHYTMRRYWVLVDIEDLSSYDEYLADSLIKVPSDYLPLFEEAATEMGDELTQPRPPDEQEVSYVNFIFLELR